MKTENRGLSGIKKIALFLFKALISIGLLYYIINRVGLTTIIDSFSKLTPLDIGVFTVLMLIIVLLASVKLAFILKIWNLHISIWYLFKWQLVSIFFTNFLPGGIGGDITRIYAIKKSRQDRSYLESFKYAFYDRFLSVVILTAIGMTAVLIHCFTTGQVSFFLYIFVLLAVILLCSSCILFKTRAGDILLKLAAFVSFKKIDFNRLVEKYIIKDADFSPMPFVLLSGMCIQLITIGIYLFVGRAISIEISFVSMAIFLPLLFIVISLPISINGVGIRDYIFILFFAQFGIGEGLIVSLSIVYFSLQLLFSLSGGIVFIFERSRRSHSANAENE